MRPMAICANSRGVTRARAARRGLALALLLCLMLPGRALAGPVLDRAVSCLQQQSVCVDPAVRHELSQSEADALAERIRSSGAGPVFIAVLPEAAKAEAGGDKGAVLRALHDSLGRPGTYAVVAGGSFGAASTGFHAGPLATAAFDARGGDGLDAVLTDFVDRVADARSGGGGERAEPSAGSGGADGSGGDGTSGTVLLAGLGILGLGGAAVAINGRRQRRRRE